MRERTRIRKERHKALKTAKKLNPAEQRKTAEARTMRYYGYLFKGFIAFVAVFAVALVIAQVLPPSNPPAHGGGDPMTDLPKSYEWDALNQLTKITYSDGSTTEFVHNSRRQRIKTIEKDDEGAVLSERRYVWLPDGIRPFEERDANNNVLRRYFPQGELVIGATPPSDKLYYVKDHLGSVRQLVDASGQVRAEYDYDPFGRRTKVSGDLDTVVGFTGHHLHDKSGLYMAWYRQYDPRLGRWLNRDPLEEIDDPNLYAYLKSNPINRTDPLGLQFLSSGVEDFSHQATSRDIMAQHHPQTLALSDECKRKCVAEHYGLTGAAVGTSLAGAPMKAKAEKAGALGAGRATSYISKPLRNLLPWKIPSGCLTKMAGTASVGGIVGRGVPFVSAGLLAADGLMIANCFSDCMNEKKDCPSKE